MSSAKWKRRLRLAQFRGVKFHIDSSQFSSGRRGVTHEYPDKDIPFREDTGRKAQGFQVDAYVLGSNYLADRDKLITACEKEGSGELVHPYYGRKIVNCETIQVSESSGEGGIAKITLTFVEAGRAEFPRGKVDSKSLVDQASAILNGSAGDEFENKFSVANAPQYVLDSANEKLEGFADTVDGVTSKFSGGAQGVADLAFGIRNFKSSIKDLLAKPASLRAQMENAMNLLKGALTASDLLAATRSLFKFGKDDKPIPTNTNTRKQQAQNSTAINQFVRALAISTAATAAAEKPYSTVDDGLATLTDLGTEIDALSDETASDDVFSGLQKLRAEATKAIPPESENLARIAKHTPVETTPSIVLAYDLYESAELESDIIARNHVEHPGFIPGGKELEVLDRG